MSRDLAEPSGKGSPKAPPAESTLVLVTRADCHLCDEMAALLDQVLGERGLSYGVRDVDAEPELAARFGEVVPVLLRDGRPVAKIRLDRHALDRLLARRRQ